MRIRLSSGAYRARSIGAACQRQVNLYAEANPGGLIHDAGEPQQAPVPTLYPTPGLRTLATAPVAGAARGLYRANNGTLFYVCGSALYTVAADWTMTAIGSIAPGTGLVSMADNGLTMVLVDGTAAGYQVDLTSGAFSVIAEATNGPTVPGTSEYAFYGADRVAEVDGYLIFNQPGGRNFYITLNGTVQFDSLNIAAKNGFADKLVAAVVNQRTLWLIGERTTEFWFDSGDTAFPFALMPGPFIQHGCIAKYSIAQLEESILWLSQDQTGGGFIVVRSNGYNVSRVSTFAIEAEFSGYATVSDAEAFCFQLQGHQFYQLSFPTADKTWRLDLTTGEWHEAVWSDASGFEHRHRSRVMAWANNTLVVGDWENGTLYALDPAVYTDAGGAIVRRRGFPHIVGDGDRVFYRSMVLDMQVGDYLGTDDPQVLLRWSDDRGRTWNNPLSNSLGLMGEYLTSVQFNRLGFARDRVFQIEWSAAANTALQGAFLTFQKGAS